MIVIFHMNCMNLPNIHIHMHTYVQTHIWYMHACIHQPFIHLYEYTFIIYFQQNRTYIDHLFSNPEVKDTAANFKDIVVSNNHDRLVWRSSTIWRHSKPKRIPKAFSLCSSSFPHPHFILMPSMHKHFMLHILIFVLTCT